MQGDKLYIISITENLLLGINVESINSVELYCYNGQHQPAAYLHSDAFDPWHLCSTETPYAPRDSACNPQNLISQFYYTDL